MNPLLLKFKMRIPMKSLWAPPSLPMRCVERATTKLTTLRLRLNIRSNRLFPSSLDFNADTYVYSILGDVQCADEKGKGKDASQLPEYAKHCFLSLFSHWQLFIRAALSPESDDSDRGHEANLDGPSVAPANDEATSDGVEDGEIGVMSPECQDPLLAQTYLGLPVLPWVYGLSYCP